MTEPRRLLSSGADTSPLEHRLLSAGRARREPAGMRDRVLLGVGAAVAAGGTAAGATAAKAATTSVPPAKVAVGALALGKTKLLVATIVVVSAAGAGAKTYLDHRPHAPLAGPVAVIATTGLAVTPPEVAQDVAPVAIPTSAVGDLPPAASAVTVAPQRPRALAPTPPPPASVVPATVNDLREEAALVDAARRALASGDPASASERLTRADERFPHGRLREERDALAVRAAASSGDRVRAAELAARFLAAHPTSPLRPSIEAIASRP